MNELEKEVERVRARLESQPAPEPNPDMSGLAEAVKEGLKNITPATAEQEKEAAWKTMSERMKENGIPARYIFALDEWGCDKQERTYRFCLSQFTGTGAIVALVGPRGTGKTVIAAQLILDRIRSDYRRIFVDFEPGYYWRPTPYRKMADLIAKFKPIYADFGSIDSDALISARASLCRHDLLIIDEVHDCDDQKMKDRILTDVLDRRYAAMKDTLLIGNQTPEEFNKVTNDSILSRISEAGAVVACRWESWRSPERREMAKTSRNHTK